MTITFDIAPNTERSLQQEAARSGINPSDIVRQLVESRYSISDDEPLDEWEALLEKSIISFPPLSKEATRRENIYEQQGHVTIDERGVPRIDGTRFKVEMIAIDHAFNGLSPREIHEAYDDLSLPQIHAALAYYYDHKEEMDARIESGARFAEEMRAKNPNPFTHDELLTRKAELETKAA